MLIIIIWWAIPMNIILFISILNWLLKYYNISAWEFSKVILSNHGGLQLFFALYNSIFYFLNICDLSLELINLGIDSLNNPVSMHMNILPPGQDLLKLPLEAKDFPYVFEITYCEIMEDYLSRVHGVQRIFPLDYHLMDDPEVLAEAYRSDGPGAWVQLIARLFSTEGIFNYGGRDAFLELNSSISTKAILNNLPGELFHELRTLCFSRINSPDSGMIILNSPSMEVPIILTLEEHEFMLDIRYMHIQAIKIVLSDTSWQPGVVNSDYIGHPKIWLNVNHDYAYFDFIREKAGTFSPSYLNLVRNHPFFRGLWDLDYTDLSIFSEALWIFDLKYISPEDILATSIDIFHEEESPEDILATSMDIFHEKESPEDILATSMDIFHEEESPEDIMTTSIDIYHEEESYEVENFYSDAVWMFEED